MDLLEKMNGALNHIEENLTNDIDFKEVARLAFCSEYHFKRMFSFLAGVTLSEYIRRRRLTLAAFELKGSNVKVIDIAMKYGYNSPDSFARAFQNLHGITPSEARNNEGAVIEQTRAPRQYARRPQRHLTCYAQKLHSADFLRQPVLIHHNHLQGSSTNGFSSNSFIPHIPMLKLLISYNSMNCTHLLVCRIK
jgi:AraC-like DNA-binding protein